MLENDKLHVVMYMLQTHVPAIFAAKPPVQVKVKNSCELKQYVSQNISSNSLNSMVNKVGVFAKIICI